MAWWQQLVIWGKVQSVLILKLQFCKRRQRHSVKKGRQDSNTRWAIGDLSKFSPQEPSGFFPRPWAGTLGSDCPKHFPTCWTQPMAGCRAGTSSWDPAPQPHDSSHSETQANQRGKSSEEQVLLLLEASEVGCLTPLLRSVLLHLVVRSWCWLH